MQLTFASVFWNNYLFIWRKSMIYTYQKYCIYCLRVKHTCTCKQNCTACRHITGYYCYSDTIPDISHRMTGKNILLYSWVQYNLVYILEEIEPHKIKMKLPFLQIIVCCIISGPFQRSRRINGYTHFVKV